jgi:hypothetical protein
LTILVVVAASLSVPVGGAALGVRFLDSLRIARPKTVSASLPVVGATNSRQLQYVVAGIVAETTTVAHDEPDMNGLTLDSASRAAGFRARVLRARADAATFSVLGAHSASARVDRGQLRTLLNEAGFARTPLPASLDNASISFASPRGVRAQYGHCPEPVANTLQAQIQGPPPPSPDNGNCVALTETPLAVVAAPAGLDTSAVMTIALELLGMSPNQAHEFRRLFPWPAALSLSPPRFMRSYELVTVHRAPAMLMITAGRRGPTYVLAWVEGGRVFTLSGYGSSADAVPYAQSVS